jgi:hypothetical protein
MLFRKRLSKGKNRLLIKEGLVTCPVWLYFGNWKAMLFWLPDYAVK